MTINKNNSTFYNGNSQLKKAGVSVSLTKEQQLEYIRCMEDPIYFAERYIKIVDVDDGLIPIKLYDYQKEIIESITFGNRVLVNSSRQAGKTTSATVILLHYIIFNDYKTVAILANKGDTSVEVLDRIKIGYEALPNWLQQGVLEWNKKSIELENGCKILAGTTSSSAIRGKSISFAYIDEAAHIENWEDFFTSVYPTISSGKKTKLLLTSTPLGLNFFFSMCEKAKNKQNSYKYIEVPWSRVPGRDEKWKEKTLGDLNGDTEKFAQEFCCQFLGSSGTLITGDRLKSLVDQTPIQKDDNLYLYKKPEKDREYAVICDVSRGKGLDHSAFSVIDISQMPYEQVCVYRNNLITPGDYAEVISRVATIFNEAYVLIEINDNGEQVSNSLTETYEYENVLYTENAGRSGKRISGGYGSNVDPGIRTTKSVKAIGCSNLKLLVEGEKLILNDKNTIEEMKVFSKKGNSYEAETGKNDDLVMGLVLFSWLSTQEFFKDITEIDTIEGLKEKRDNQVEEELLPFGFTYDDIVEETHDDITYFDYV